MVPIAIATKRPELITPTHFSRRRVTSRRSRLRAMGEVYQVRADSAGEAEDQTVEELLWEREEVEDVGDADAC